MKKLKMLKQGILVLALMAAGVHFFASPELMASAQLMTQEDIIDSVSGATGGETDLRSLIKKIVNFFLGFLGFVAVLFVIYGGVTYVTAGDSDDATENAKKIIKNALIGIILILISIALVNLVLGAAQ